MINRHPQAKGFTLLEIIITLSIIVLFISSAASFIVRDKVSELDEFISVFQKYARETKMLASSSDESIYLTITKDKIWRSYGSEKNKPAKDSMIEMPEDVTVFLKREKDKQWQAMEIQNNNSLSWLFSRSGCCEAVEIKFIHQDSERYYKYDYLTAYPIEDTE